METGDTNPRGPSRSLQRACVLAFGRSSELSQRQAAPCLGDFRQLASLERTLLRNQSSGASNATTPRSLLYRHSQDPLLRHSFSRVFRLFALLLLLLFSFFLFFFDPPSWYVEAEDTYVLAEERRGKSSTGVIRRYRARYPGYRTPGQRVYIPR